MIGQWLRILSPLGFPESARRDLILFNKLGTDEPPAEESMYSIESNRHTHLEGELSWHDSLQTHFGNLIQGTVLVNNIST